MLWLCSPRQSTVDELLRWTQKMQKPRGRQAWKALCPELLLIQGCRLQLGGPLTPSPTSPIDTGVYTALKRWETTSAPYHRTPP